MHSRPTLSPLAYRLRLPRCGLYVRYVRAANQNNRQIIGTVHPHQALSFPEAQALRVAGELSSCTGHLIRLDPVQPGQGRGAGSCQP